MAQSFAFLFHTGSIIRCMRRLEELLRQMCQAAKAIGNTELENKFAEGMYFAFTVHEAILKEKVMGEGAAQVVGAKGE